MGIFSSISAILSDTPIGKVVDRAVDSIFPDKLSEGERLQLQMEIQKAEHAQMLEVQKAAAEVEAEFNDRIKSMEGTAGDLKAVPIVGPIVLFLRGLQRPTLGFATLWIDFQWFSSGFKDMSDRQEATMLTINILVLGFLFGERAIKNVMPFVAQVWGRGQTGDEVKK
jgi:hypothetical protein